MGSDKLSPARRAILEMLAKYSALTTTEIAQRLTLTTTRRALQQHLAGLRDQGLIAEAKSRPELGRAAERSWSLLEAGCLLLLGESGSSGASFSPPPTQRILRPLTDNHAGILALLAEWKQLTRPQIWAYLHPDKDPRYTRRLLTDLKVNRMVRDVVVDPTAGNAGDRYWMLLKRGAAAVEATYDKHYRRRPSPALLAYRGLQLDLINQVAGAGWALHRPIPYRLSRPRPAETPQYQQLVAAVVDHERQEIARLLAACYPQSSLQHRIDRANAGQVGALVSHGVNEYVAFVPGQPALTALLLPHPPHAGRAFWTRKPEPIQGRSEQWGRRESRADRYTRLAAILPVIAVFADAATGHQYAPLLQRAGFEWVMVDALATYLARLPTALPRTSMSPFSGK